MKLVLVISALTAGGAERVMSIMANDWAERGWDICLLTLDDGSVPPFFALHERIRHRPLGLLGDSAHPWNALSNNAKRLWVLRDTLRAERPDAVISFLDAVNVLTLLASRGLGIPVIVSEHIDPAQYRIKPVWNALRRLVYPRADKVVVLTERVLEFFPASLRPRMDVIPNPVLPPRPDEGAAIPPLPSGRRVVAMGRLVGQKGFDILLDAFARLRERYPDWHLVVLGEGPDRLALEARRDQLGLEGRVFLPGNWPCPEAVLSRSDLFVLSSRFEGFPMVLCEAMACGLPVVAADCPTGPREIVRDGRDGLLVPPEDPARLAEAMDRLMADDAERRRLGARAAEITGRFGLARIMGRWEDILQAVRAEREGSAHPAGRNS